MIKEIRQEALELVEKQSWVRKGFSELITKMNEEVADIEGDFAVRGRLFEASEEYNVYFLTFTGEYDAEFAIQQRGWDHEDVDTDDCAISIIRKCALHIPDALSEILEKLHNLNGEYQEAIEKIGEMTIALE